MQPMLLSRPRPPPVLRRRRRRHQSEVTTTPPPPAAARNSTWLSLSLPPDVQRRMRFYLSCAIIDLKFNLWDDIQTHFVLEPSRHDLEENLDPAAGDSNHHQDTEEEEEEDADEDTEDEEEEEEEEEEYYKELAREFNEMYINRERVR
uniref:Uncharacterized protein n=1 Tax=Oryza punctata TaxID=4537 RepID=A0A0E0LSM5_ORYPU